MDEWMDGWMDGWMDERTNERTNERTDIDDSVHTMSAVWVWPVAMIMRTIVFISWLCLLACLLAIPKQSREERLGSYRWYDSKMVMVMAMAMAMAMAHTA